MYHKFLNIETGKTFVAGGNSKTLYEHNKLIKHLGSCHESGELITASGVVYEEKKVDEKTIQALKKEMLEQNRVDEDEKGRPKETKDSYDIDDEQ